MQINPFVRSHINKNSHVTTDGFRAYSDMKYLVNEHQQKVVPKNQIEKVLPWVHITLSNLKRLILNTYHCVHTKYLQLYLNEFTYKFNRRYQSATLFDTLINSCAKQFY